MSNKFPKELIDEMNGETPEGETAPGSAPDPVAGPTTDNSPTTSDNSPTSAEGGEGEGGVPQILSPDQQAVMHRISEAIAILVYDQQTNKPLIQMAMGGADGVVRAVSIIVNKVAESAKPGVPRELLPTTALAALMIINDFLERLGQKPPEMREVLPALIDKLGSDLKATPMEMAQMRRIKAKFNRADQRSIMQKSQEGPPAEEAVEMAQDGTDTDSAAEGEE